MTKLRASLLALALALGAPWVSAQSNAPLVQRELAGRHHNRFVELPSAHGSAFRAVAPGRRLAFESTGVQLQMASNGGAEAKRLGSGAASGLLSYRFEGGATVAPQGVGLSPTVYHWLVGARSEWLTDLRSYAGLAYPGVWPGVDAVFAADASGFKYQFELRAGVDPTVVALRVQGADALRVNAAGALEWTIGSQVVVDDAPVAYQLRGAERVLVPVAYRVEAVAAGDWRVGFRLGPIDPALPLVIDPAWTGYSGLVGGNAQDQVNAVARDASANTYACGSTRSSSLPLASSGNQGGDDAFVAKFSPAGVALAVSYVGGSGHDACNSLALDSSGNVYLAGGTESTNFPAVGTDAASRLRRTKNSDRDAFVLKMPSSLASITYSGFIGGSEDDQANGLAVDSQGRAYVTGFSTCTATAAAGCTTAGTAFPALVGPSLQHGGDTLGTGGMDAFVARVKADGSGLEYAGFIGGNGGADVGHAVAVASDNTAYVAGATDSDNLGSLTALRSTFNSRAADAMDAFVASVPDGGASAVVALLSGSAPAGGESGADRALAVAIDADGSVLVAGETDSQNFPANNAGTRLGSGPQTSNAGGMDAFVLRLNTAGSSVLSATYLGGTGHDSAEGVAADAAAWYVAGNSNPGTGFPTQAQSGLGTSRPGGQDVFLSRIARATPTSLSYSGFLGTSGHDAVHALAASVVTGSTILSLGGATTIAQSSSLSNPVVPTGTNYAATSGVVWRIDPFGPPSSVVAQAGSTPQSTPILSAFGNTLQVTVTDVDGLAVPNAVVTFTAPASGASTNWASGITTATTDASGVASVSATANGLAGAYTVTAQAGSVSTPFSLTNLKGNQAALSATATPTGIVYGGTATLATTGGTVAGSSSFAVSAGGSFCSVSGSTLSGIGVGTCTVTATLAGNANYNDVTTTVDVVVSKANQTGFTATATPTSVVRGATSTLGSTGGQGGGAVSYASSAGCSINGNVLTGDAIGTCTVTATKAGDANYNLTTGTVDVAVTQAPQAALTATATPSSLAYGGSSTLGTSGGSGTGAVSYTVTAGGSYCSVSGSTLSAIGVGTCTVTATKAGDADYLSAQTTVNVTVSAASQGTLTALASPAAIAYGATSALSVSGGQGTGAVSYAVTAGGSFCSVAGSTLSGTGIGTCTVTATKAADANYTVAQATVDVLVSKANQATLTVLITPASLAYNGTTALSTSGGGGTGAVSYAVTAGGSFCSVAGSTLSGTGIGTCTVTATKAADANYNAAQATLDVGVGKAAQTITFGGLAGKVLGDPDFTVGATASSGLTVGFASGTPLVCSVSGSTVHLQATGTCTVTASQAGNGNYNAATSVPQSFSVNLPAGVTGTLSGTAGSGGATATISGAGWVFGPPGTGTFQSGGFIPMNGHAKSPGSGPSGFSFPYGLFDFVAMGGTPGSTVTITLTFASTLPPGAKFWKYGPTAGNTTPHWYQFPATISGNTVTLSIVDGGLGDDDLSANGVVLDAGGPGIPDDSGAAAIPTLTEWGQWLLALLVAGLGWAMARRRPTGPQG